MPVACMSAYAVVGPTKRKPRFFRSLASAVDSGVTAGTSARVAGRGRGAGANDHSSFASPSGSVTATRALCSAASIFARLRTMPGSASSRAASSAPGGAPPAARRDAWPRIVDPGCRRVGGVVVMRCRPRRSGVPR